MTLMQTVGLVVAMALAAYLVVALLIPEKLS